MAKQMLNYDSFFLYSILRSFFYVCLFAQFFLCKYFFNVCLCSSWSFSGPFFMPNYHHKVIFLIFCLTSHQQSRFQYFSKPEKPRFWCLRGAVIPFQLLHFDTFFRKYVMNEETLTLTIFLNSSFRLTHYSPLLLFYTP